MKNILVTGAGGFIGSTLTELLVKKGYNVKAFIHYNSTNTWGWLEYSQCKSNIEIVRGDIRDYDSVSDAIKGVDAVFHLAALIGIPYSYVSPLAYIKTNIEGTYNILQASKHHNLENILITSTSETYGTAQYVPINESHPMVGQSPYSASKIAADQLAISYQKSFGLPVKIVRPFNTYGPRQSCRAIIPTIITQLLKESKTLSVGSLTPTRDLTFVEDTANGFYEIAKSNDLMGEIINVGTNFEISIKELIYKIANLLNKDINIETDEKRIRPVNSEVERLWCDNAKILKLTDWKPKETIDTGLAKTIEWFKENYKLYKETIYNI